MSYPKQKEIGRAILLVLNSIGGEAKTDVIYDRVAKHFPQITDEELVRRFGIGEKKWTNLVRGAKFRLTVRGEVISSSRGVWRITNKGKQTIGEKI